MAGRPSVKPRRRDTFALFGPCRWQCHDVRALAWPSRAIPPLRADMQMLNDYTYRQEAPLPFPIQAFGGQQDPVVDAERLQGWQHETCLPRPLRQFAGGHFFIESQAPALFEAITHALFAGASP